MYGTFYSAFPMKCCCVFIQTTWTSAYDKMDHEMTFKCGFERFEDCDFKLSYDFTSQGKKTVGLTWFTNPRYPVDFKAEAEMGDNMRAMVELSTPFDDYKLMKSTVEVNKASQPWTVSMESQFNDKTVKTEGMLWCSCYALIIMVGQHTMFSSTLFVKRKIQNDANLFMFLTRHLQNIHSIITCYMFL